MQRKTIMGIRRLDDGTVVCAVRRSSFEIQGLRTADLASCHMAGGGRLTRGEMAILSARAENAA